MAKSNEFVTLAIANFRLNEKNPIQSQGLKRISNLGEMAISDPGNSPDYVK